MNHATKKLVNFWAFRNKCITFFKLRQERVKVFCSSFGYPFWRFYLSLSQRRNKALLFSPLLLQITFFKMSESDKKASMIANLLAKSDELYEKREFKEIIKLLQENVAVSDELIWRSARATYEVEKLNPNKQEQLQAIESAFALLERALVINEQNGYVHKWYVILLNTILEHRGVKEKINRGEELKSHLEAAIKYIPTDPTSCHLLGVWYFSVAELTWYERKIASLIYATPPSGTYDEALKYFEKAEEIKPAFYGKNFLMLGKCYLKLKQNDKARDVLIKARDYEVLDAEDKKVQDEAISLLKSNRLI